VIRAHLARRFGYWLGTVFGPRPSHRCADSRGDRCAPDRCALGDRCPNRPTSYGELVTGDFGPAEGAEPQIRESDDVCRHCGSPYFECETPAGTCGREEK